MGMIPSLAGIQPSSAPYRSWAFQTCPTVGNSPSVTASFFRGPLKSNALATLDVAWDTEVQTETSSGAALMSRAKLTRDSSTSAIHLSQSIPSVLHDSRYLSAASRARSSCGAWEQLFMGMKCLRRCIVPRTASMSYAGFAGMALSGSSSFDAANLASRPRFGSDVTNSLLFLSQGWSQKNHPKKCY